jgi:AbrB family looped-hinge helix DNA binding protein
MRITSKGQVTIPQEIREELGLLPHTEVEFTVEGGRAVLQPKNGQLTRGQQLVKHIREHGTGKMIMSSKELLAMLRDEPDELDAD